MGKDDTTRLLKRCKTCPALCCVVAGEVNLTYDEALVLSTVTGKPLNDIVIPVSENGKEGFVIKKGPGLVCPFVDNDNRCSVYLYRPETCRTYSCLGDPVMYQLWRNHRYVRNNPNYVSK